MKQGIPFHASRMYDSSTSIADLQPLHEFCYSEIVLSEDFKKCMGSSRRYEIQMTTWNDVHESYTILNYFIELFEIE